MKPVHRNRGKGSLARHKANSTGMVESPGKTALRQALDDGVPLDRAVAAFMVDVDELRRLTTQTQELAAKIPSTMLPPVPVNPHYAAKLTEAATLARKWTETRDGLVCVAIKNGGSLREVAALVGLSHAGVKRIVERAR